MWRHKSNQRHYWIAIQEDLEAFLKELLQIERDEEVDLYRFQLHLNSKEELNVFNAKEKKRIVRLINKLSSDTRRHSRTISRIHRLLNGFKVHHERGL